MILPTFIDGQLGRGQRHSGGCEQAPSDIGRSWDDGRPGHRVRRAAGCLRQNRLLSPYPSVAAPGTYGFLADVSPAVARKAIRPPLNAHDDVDVRLVPYCHESARTGIAAYLNIGECIDDNHMESRPVFDTALHVVAWPIPPDINTAPQKGKASALLNIDNNTIRRNR